MGKRSAIAALILWGLPAAVAFAQAPTAPQGQPPSGPSASNPPATSQQPCGGGAVQDWRHTQPTPERDRCLGLQPGGPPASASSNPDVRLGAQGVPQTMVPTGPNAGPNNPATPAGR